MRTSDALDEDTMRVHVFGLLFLFAILFLGAWLWRVQVVHASSYAESLDRQSMRRVRLPGTRGRIFDRNGVCLADNRPSYCIAIYVEELRCPGPISNTVNRIEQVLGDISGAIGLARQVSRNDIENHIRKSRPLPLLAWRDIDNAALARLEENSSRFPGADVYVEPMRKHTLPGLAAHLLGHVGRLDLDTSEPYHFYLPEMEGRAGIEESLNNRLSGVAGGSLIRVDVSGFRYEEEEVLEAIAGEDVTLTIDSRIQAMVERELAGNRGAAVLLDARNGDVLAMASAPGFDPIAMRSMAEYARLSEDERRPLFNRAIAGLYPPGSIFKPLVAIAALESGRAVAGTTFDCPGYFKIGNVPIDCWNKAGHGMIGMRKAIEQSCNSYFCQLGLQSGWDRVWHVADAIGLGHATGIELRGEKDGLVPDDAWKRRVMKDGWRPGDTCNGSIGQGAVLVTPLQMAVMVATLANGGSVFRPRLVCRSSASPGDRVSWRGHVVMEHLAEARKREPDAGELVGRMNWSSETLRVVRGGMYDVVQGDEGTGKRARIAGIEMGGKTGSAEYGPRDARKKYTWVICFAPFDAPRYALAMVIEEGVSGGLTTAPLVHNVMNGIFALEQGRELSPAAEGNAS